MATASTDPVDLNDENETKEIPAPEYSPKKGIMQHIRHISHCNANVDLRHFKKATFSKLIENLNFSNFWTGQTTLSTSTSSYEPLETHDPNLNRLAITMFDRVSEYLKSEMTTSESEYRLIEEMNKVTTAKYQDLTKIAANVGKGVIELNEKCTAFWFFNWLKY